MRITAFYASLARISFCVAFLFALMFPICEEVFSTPVGRVSRFAPMLIEYASMACSMRSTYVSLLRNSVFYARISFLRIFPLCVAANWRRQHFFAENTRRKETNILLCINLDTTLGTAPKRTAPKWKRAKEKRAEEEARQSKNAPN